MAGRTWNADRAAAWSTSTREAYKSIDQVMEDQKDLVDDPAHAAPGVQLQGLSPAVRYRPTGSWRNRRAA